MTLYMRSAYDPTLKRGLLQIATNKANDIARLANLLGDHSNFTETDGRLCAALAVPSGMALADSAVAAGESAQSGPLGV
jgi:hypothetical protein